MIDLLWLSNTEKVMMNSFKLSGTSCSATVTPEIDESAPLSVIDGSLPTKKSISKAQSRRPISEDPINVPRPRGVVSSRL